MGRFLRAGQKFLRDVRVETHGRCPDPGYLVPKDAGLRHQRMVTGVLWIGMPVAPVAGPATLAEIEHARLQVAHVGPGQHDHIATIIALVIDQVRPVGARGGQKGREICRLAPAVDDDPVGGGQILDPVAAPGAAKDEPVALCAADQTVIARPAIQPVTAR
jgi:hypothetical protein